LGIRIRRRKGKEKIEQCDKYYLQRKDNTEGQ